MRCLQMLLQAWIRWSEYPDMHVMCLCECECLFHALYLSEAFGSCAGLKGGVSTHFMSYT
jgi:hypothetical protein